MWLHNIIPSCYIPDLPKYWFVVPCLTMLMFDFSMLLIILPILVHRNYLDIYSCKLRSRPLLRLVAEKIIWTDGPTEYQWYCWGSGLLLLGSPFFPNGYISLNHVVSIICNKCFTRSDRPTYLALYPHTLIKSTKNLYSKVFSLKFYP